MALPASDDFNRADANPVGGNWTTSPGCSACQISTNRLHGSASSAHNSAYWSADTFDADQWSQVTLSTVADGGPAVRIITSGTSRTMYALEAISNLWSFKKIVANTETTISSWTSRTNNNGEVWKLTAEGTTLTATAGGSDLATATDSAISSGAAGVWSWESGTYWDDWSGGNVSAGAATPVPVFMNLYRQRWA